MTSDGISAHARQFQRHSIRYEVRIEPDPDHADQFRLSFPDAQMDMAVIDVSKGGVGLQSGVFLPKSMRLTLHISSTATDGDVHAQDMTIRGIVRRCAMTDHKPTYQIGIQFVDAQGHDEQVLIGSATEAASEVVQTASIGGAGVS